MKNTRKKSVLLLGAYGQTNLGDDLLLFNYLSLLTDRGYTHIYINASVAKLVPKTITNTFSNIIVFETYHTSPFKIFKLLLQSNIVVYGGGTVYKELYKTTGRSKYSVLVGTSFFNLTATLLRKRVYAMGIGIGTIKSGLGAQLTKLALVCSHITYFRDRESYDYSKNKLHIKNEKIQLSTDGLFINDIWRTEQSKSQHTLSRKVIGLNVLYDIPDWIDRDRYYSSIIDFVNNIQDDSTIVFLPFQTDFNRNNDLEFINREIIPNIKHSNYSIIENLSIDNVIENITSCDIFICMRFHAMLLAFTSDVPFVGISYDPKCKRLLEEAGYDFNINLEDLTSDKLTHIVNEAHRNTEKIQNISHDFVEDSYTRASKWLEDIKI